MANKAIICPTKGFLMSRTNIFNHCKHLLGRCDHTARSSDLYSNSLLTHFLFLFLFVGHRPNGTCQPGTGGKDGQMCPCQTNKSSLLVINVLSGPTMAATHLCIQLTCQSWPAVTPPPLHGPDRDHETVRMKPRKLAFFWRRRSPRSFLSDRVVNRLLPLNHQRSQKSAAPTVSESSLRGRLCP